MDNQFPIHGGGMYRYVGGAEGCAAVAHMVTSVAHATRPGETVPVVEVTTISQAYRTGGGGDMWLGGAEDFYRDFRPCEQ
jgi:hypothetical protein